MSNAGTAAERHEPVPGSTVGPWLILQRVGAGSYGVVYLARRANAPDADPVALKELLRRHQHPAIPRYEDAGVWISPSGQSYPFVVMEWVEGVTLYHWMRERAPPSDLAVVCPELEDIILRLLSDDRETRGAAEQLVLPIVPTSHALPTEDGYQVREEAGSSSADSSMSSIPQHRERSGRGLIVPAWLSWASAAVVGGLIVAAALELRRLRPLEPAQPPEPVPWSMTEESHTPEADTPDAGMGEEALLSTVQAPRPVSPGYSVGLPMPKVPQPGQKKPPCDGAEVAALGACWVVLDKKPPCESLGYELASRCVRGSFESPREPTSGEP